MSTAILPRRSEALGLPSVRLLVAEPSRRERCRLVGLHHTGLLSQAPPEQARQLLCVKQFVEPKMAGQATRGRANSAVAIRWLLSGIL